MTRKEAAFEKKVRKELDRLALCYVFPKRMCMTVKGMPDIFFVVNGNAIAWELKVDSKLSPLQKHTMKTLWNAGIEVTIVTPQNFKRELEEICLLTHSILRKNV